MPWYNKEKSRGAFDVVGVGPIGGPGRQAAHITDALPISLGA